MGEKRENDVHRRWGGGHGKGGKRKTFVPGIDFWSASMGKERKRRYGYESVFEMTPMRVRVRVPAGKRKTVMISYCLLVVDVVISGGFLGEGADRKPGRVAS